MSLIAECLDCGKQYRVADDKAGRQFKCKDCGSTIQIPGGDDDDYDLGHHDEYGADDRRGGDYDEPRPRRRSGGSGRKKSRSKRKSSVNPGLIIGGVVGGIVVIGVLVGAVVLIRGSFSPVAKHRKLANDALAVLDDFASALEDIHDQESAREAAVKINKLTDRMEEIAKRNDDLPKITKVQNDELEEEFKDKFELLKPRLKTATFKAARWLATEPTLKAAILRLSSVRIKHGGASRRF